MLEWRGAFLAFYRLSYLGRPRMAMALSESVSVAGSLYDIILLGGMTPRARGSLAGRMMKEFKVSK